MRLTLQEAEATAKLKEEALDKAAADVKEAHAVVVRCANLAASDFARIERPSACDSLTGCLCLKTRRRLSFMILGRFSGARS